MSEVYSEEDGVKYDAHIHGPILASIAPKADEKHMRRARRRAKEVHKLSDATARKLYGDEK